MPEARAAATTRSAAVHRIGERLFAEHMRAGGESLDGEIGMGLGIGADGDGVGLQLDERIGEIVEARHIGKFGGEVGALGGAMRAKAGKLEARRSC